MPRLGSLGWCLLVISITAGLLAGCTRTSPVPDPEVEEPLEAPWFAEIGKARGLDFVHDAGEPSDRYFLPQIMGSGVALFDFNNDGLLDLYLIQNGGPKGATNRLYQQLPNGQF